MAYNVETRPVDLRRERDEVTHRQTTAQLHQLRRSFVIVRYGITYDLRCTVLDQLVHDIAGAATRRLGLLHQLIDFNIVHAFRQIGDLILNRYTLQSVTKFGLFSIVVKVFPEVVRPLVCRLKRFGSLANTTSKLLTNASTCACDGLHKVLRFTGRDVETFVQGILDFAQLGVSSEDPAPLCVSQVSEDFVGLSLTNTSSLAYSFTYARRWSSFVKHV